MMVLFIRISNRDSYIAELGAIRVSFRVPFDVELRVELEVIFRVELVMLAAEAVTTQLLVTSRLYPIVQLVHV